MKLVRFIILAFTASCTSAPSSRVDPGTLYKEFLYIDSLASTYPDSAFYYYNRAAANSSDSGYKGTYLQRMAVIQQNAGDYNGSNESAIQSLTLFDQKNKKHYPNIFFDYNLLATNCINLNRYDDAIRYYDFAYQFSDSSNTSVFLNNKGVVYQKKKDYDKAIEHFQLALKDTGADTSFYAMIVSNLGRSRWLHDRAYKPRNELHEARSIRESMKDKLGLNASYSHLADFYMGSNPDSALVYAEKMYEVAKDLNSADDQVEALEKLIRLSSGSNIKNYFDRYHFLTDSIRLARANAKNEFADIRYAAEQARADNLVLEKDNSQKKLRITRQRAVIYGTLALFTLMAIWGLSWYKRRKRVQEAYTRNAIRESELKTSRKVHDVVANGLYRIMADLEHKDDIQKEKLLDNIENLYEQSRDISYEQPVNLSGNFPEALNELLTSFATPETKVLVVGNQASLWESTSSKAREELLYVLQELMINMKKHSEAGNVVVRFQPTGKDVVIHYKDDGKGLPPYIQPGNGMRNTGNRIKAIGGSIIFDGNKGKGLDIEIYFPISKST